MSKDTKQYVGIADAENFELHDTIPADAKHYRVKRGVLVCVEQARSNILPYKILQEESTVVAGELRITSETLLETQDQILELVLGMCFRNVRDKICPLLTEIPQEEWERQFQVD